MKLGIHALKLWHYQQLIPIWWVGKDLPLHFIHFNESAEKWKSCDSVNVVRGNLQIINRSLFKVSSKPTYEAYMEILRTSCLLANHWWLITNMCNFITRTNFLPWPTYTSHQIARARASPPVLSKWGALHGLRRGNLDSRATTKFRAGPHQSLQTDSRGAANPAWGAIKNPLYSLWPSGTTLEAGMLLLHNSQCKMNRNLSVVWRKVNHGDTTTSYVFTDFYWARSWKTLLSTTVVLKPSFRPCHIL